MALSDNDVLKYKPSRKPRPVGKRQYRWSDSQKIEAVTAYLALGSLRLAAATLKIPFETLNSWTKTEWWKDTRDQLKTQEDLQVSNRLKRIMEKGLTVIEDRLENGDWLYDSKSGEFHRKGVSMKDALAVTSNLAERKDILVERHMEEKSIASDKIQATLDRLAASFAAMANQPKNVVVTDVIEVEKKET